MQHLPQLRINALVMRGGTSKGIFFRLQDLPTAAQQPGAARDALLLRVLGSPDPYGQQIDGLGGATSSTSKAVILAPSQRPGHDVDYWFGQVAIGQALVDWSGNCGNLSAAVAPAAIEWGLLAPERLLRDGCQTVRIWQANTAKTIVAQVPMAAGQVQEMGDLSIDGVAFPAAEIGLQFLDPAAGAGALFPTGLLQEQLLVPGMGRFTATLIDAGIPTIMLAADELGLSANACQSEINAQPQLLARLEAIRAQGALQMGLIQSLEQASQRPHSPKLLWLAPPSPYCSASGKAIAAAEFDLLVRALSMGRLHHALMGTAAVALAAAAAIPGTLVSQLAGGVARQTIVLGHPSGLLRVGAVAAQQAEGWQIEQVQMARSARILMQGQVRVPADCFNKTE